MAFQLIVNTQGRFTDAEQFGNVIVKSGEEADGVGSREGHRAGRANRARIRHQQLLQRRAGRRHGGSTSVLDQMPWPRRRALKKTIAELGSRVSRRAWNTTSATTPTEFIAESVAAVEHTVFEAVIPRRHRHRRVSAELAGGHHSAGGNSGFAHRHIRHHAGILGFSLKQSLRCSGLVLAIGIVVDDAIVVVENVERWIAQGLSHATRLTNQWRR